MAGHSNADPDVVDGVKLVGWNRVFNSYTDYGRRNCGIASLAGWALIIGYFVLRPKKAAEPKQAPK